MTSGRPRADNIGKYGACGKEFTEVATGDGAGSTTDQIPDKFLESYIFDSTSSQVAEYGTGANLHDSGVAGGHVGLMRTGTIIDGQSMDVKTTPAMRAAGGYAGTMTESGSASSFGSIQLFGDKRHQTIWVRCSTWHRYSCLSSNQTRAWPATARAKITAAGEDITHGTGNAGGYVGLAVGGQIWGDLDQNGQKLADGVTAAGANVSNLRKVEGRNNVGGIHRRGHCRRGRGCGHQRIRGSLQGILDSLVSNPASLVSVLQATGYDDSRCACELDDPAWDNGQRRI